MNLHQVLTGAVNPGESCFSVGSVGKHPFTAYGSGCDVVVLGSDFERIQIIPGAKHGNVQVGCVEASPRGGQIAASYGSVVCVFEPLEVRGTAQKALNYHWQKTGQLVLHSVACVLAWHPSGSCLLTGSACLQLWCDVPSDAKKESEPSQNSWRCVWQCQTAAPTHFMKFSPDGEFFATAGQDDCLVKVWYSASRWQQDVSKLFTPLQLHSGSEINFLFVYLAHPRSVSGFTWRKTSSFMPRGSVCNVLLTCCKDSVCRLWAETLLPSDCLLSGLRHANHNNNDLLKHRRNNNTKEQLYEGQLWRDQIRSLSQLSYSEPLVQQQNKHFTHRANILHANALCHFHIAASINPATDIPLLPSISSLSGREDEDDEDAAAGSFTVHWLNNKELQLSLNMEVFLQQNGEDEALLDHQLDKLLADWNRAADMLFSIHPADGSLLVWLVDWLDEYQPGMFRQAQVSFVSRIPVAFPTGDANSLGRSVVMYACNKNVDLAIQHGRQRPTSLPHSSSALIGQGQNKPSCSSMRLSIFTPSVLMISTHADGSLNLWTVGFAEDSAFSTVLSVSHKSRYCGHRFHLNDLACHSLLPLLLTTSHHNAERSPDVDASGGRRVSAGGPAPDPSAIYSELILWRVDPVGPLSFSGGVSELARVNSLHTSAFSNVAWLPTLIPSYCLGVYGNSPSACFIASDGKSLRLYQAVIEAKKLLSELSCPDVSKRVGEVFNIISQQSTARPGCIIELDAITEFQGKEIQLLHVFEEHLILGEQEVQDSGEDRTLFSSRFFLVVVESTENQSRLHTWHLQIDALPISPAEGETLCDGQQSDPSTCRLTLTSAAVCGQDLPLPEGVRMLHVTPAAGHLSSSSLQPAGQAPYLLATTCSDGTVRFWRCGQEPDSASYWWEEWPLLVEAGVCSSSALSISGPLTGLSCCHTSRVAVAHCSAARDGPTRISVFQCESTGGSRWILEQTLLIEASSGPESRASHLLDGTPRVHLDWVSREDGSHVLTVGLGSKIYIYGKLGGKPPELSLSASGPDCARSRLVLLRLVEPVSSVEGSPAVPASLSWVRDGILVVGMECEMHVYSQWRAGAGSSLALRQDALSPNPCRRGLTRSTTSLAQKLSGKRTVYDLPAEMEDCGLFEAAHHLFPVLPQYHPVLLLELMDLGRLRRAKAILSHLVKSMAGEVVTLRDSAVTSERRGRSLTISASGSTSRSHKSFSKSESLDYTEIDSVPPLPLYALLAADDETAPAVAERVDGASAHTSARSDAYDELFTAGAGADDLDAFGADEDEPSPEVIDLSKYGPTFFGPEHAQVLSQHLLHSSLPGLTRTEQMCLMALADTIASTGTDAAQSGGGDTLDECGLKFLLAVRLHTFLLTSLPPAHRAPLLRQGLSTCHHAWAFHSEAEEELLHMLPALQKDEPGWPELRAMGLGWWLRSNDKLRRCIEKVAKAAYQRNSDPLDAALFYLSLRKKAVVWGLYRSQQNAKMTSFFSNNFSEERWRRAALKNAYSLLGKQRFQHSAAFFLLAGSLKDAVEVCVEKLQDLQLALVISRLYESETSCTYKRILQRHVLGQDPQIPAHQDPFLRSMAYWVLDDYGGALDTLLVQPSAHKDGSDPGASFSCNPEVFNFYTFLRTHPLLQRRHLASSEQSRVGLSAEGRPGDSISLTERRLFFSTAYAHLQAGCPMLALEVLSKMPRAVTCSALRVEEKCAGSLEWSCGTFDAPSDTSPRDESRSDSVLSLDWSQPSITLPSEPLELKWDSDGEEEESGLAMKTIDPEEPASPLATPPPTDAGPLLLSEDILAARLKFSSCLKILTTELRTLSSGCELDGGKLRHQLCHWLEREVAVLQRCCGYNPRLPRLPEGVSSDLGQPEVRDAPVQCRRRLWLQRNQPLLRIFLSYCGLHGAHGGGLASVRMELTLLLQESQQDAGLQICADVQQHVSLPLLLAWTASAKTVVANPIVHLRNLTHDILCTINALDTPPHPDALNNQIHVMHTLAASLSACIYQCLCDGFSHSHVNPFTGFAYQSLLLSHQPSVRSLEEAVLPNTAPAQWPGVTALLQLLGGSGEESQPGLAVLLCEVLTAVFLSLFVHGLATHSAQQLLRVAAHPLCSRLWASVFGGGVRAPAAEKPCSPSGEDVESRRRLFRLRSSSRSSRETPEGGAGGPERFVPPELSIWDYFMAKPFLAPSVSQDEYDSDESPDDEEEEEEEEDEEGERLEPSSPLLEHSNHSSFSWCLMRLALVQMVVWNLKSFYPAAGHDLLDLPVCSPLCHAALKTLQRWEQLMFKRLEVFAGAPDQFLCSPPLDESVSSGPALLRHKALLEPANTPFRSCSRAVLPVRRLWRYLVKQEEVQDTFIRNIFGRKRDPGEDGAQRDARAAQVDGDVGNSGGKARIIHKESDIITAFAINKANQNCLVIASTHDIQELDVSSILATQILTWIDDETEAEAKGSDDFLVVHAHDDLCALHGSTPYTHSSPGTPINMPWLGGLQTGRGASVLIKRNITNVRRMASHPTLPYYLTGAQDGSVRMFEWGHQQQITCFRAPGNSKVTRIRFNHQGNKFGVLDVDGSLSLWQTSTSGNGPKPYLMLQCHTKTANDFVFVGSSSLIATAGLSADNRNVCVWDTLVPAASSLVQGFSCHESGATVLALACKQQQLMSGGRKGWISVLDLTRKLQRHSFPAHESPVKALAVDGAEERLISGSAEGSIKVWSIGSQTLLHTFTSEHARQSLFRNLGTGVMQVESGPANQLFSCGADGSVKLRLLPDAFSPTHHVKLVM